MKAEFSNNQPTNSTEEPKFKNSSLHAEWSKRYDECEKSIPALDQIADEFDRAARNWDLDRSSLDFEPLDRLRTNFLTPQVLKDGIDFVVQVVQTAQDEKIQIKRKPSGGQSDEKQIVAAETPASGAAETPTTVETPVASSEHPVGDGMKWRVAKRLAEKHVENNGFPGVRLLARIVGCSNATITKAIENSLPLREAKHRNKESKTRVSVSSVTSDIIDKVCASTSLDPADAAARKEQEENSTSEERMNKLIEQSHPKDQARLKAMTRQEKINLLANIDSVENGKFIR